MDTKYGKTRDNNTKRKKKRFTITDRPNNGLKLIDFDQKLTKNTKHTFNVHTIGPRYRFCSDMYPVYQTW